MDKINPSGLPAVSGLYNDSARLSLSGTLSEPPKDFDSVEIKSRREERIGAFLDKVNTKVLGAVEIASVATAGASMGVAAAFCAVGGTVPLVVGGALGALTGCVLHKLGIDDDIGRAFKAGQAVILMPFAYTAKHVKNAFSRVLDMVSSSGKDDKTSLSAAPNEGIIPEQAGIKSLDVEKDSVRRLSKKLVDGLGMAAKAARAIPKFIYPAIKNATASEKELILKTLDSLPLNAATSAGYISVNPELVNEMGADGFARNMFFDSAIELNKDIFSDPKWASGVLTHEIGHALDYKHITLSGLGKSSAPPFGKAPFFFEEGYDIAGEPPYSATNHFEDFAQTHKAFYLTPEALKSQTPEKFEAMKNFVKPGIQDKILDRPSIRNLGKKVGAMMDKVPGLRTAISVASSVLGPLTIHNNSETLEQGIMENNAEKRFAGKMGIAKGMAYTARILAPAGLALALAQWLAGRRIKKGAMTIGQAEKFASNILATLTGPVGLTYLAATRELLGTRETTKIKSVINKENEPLDKNKANLKLTRSDKIQIAKVGVGAVAGGAAGTAAGFFGGGLAGAVVGGLIGGPFGAAILGLAGKVAGTLFLSYEGAKLGARAAKNI